MERKNILGLSLIGLAAIGTQTAVAQIALQPQAIPYESFVLIPTLNAKTAFDNNLYSSSADEVSSFYQVLNPSLNFVAQDRLNVYKLTYNLNAAGYANDSDDSYNDHTLDFNAHLEPTSRVRYDAGVAYAMLHDARGTGASSGFNVTQILAMGEVDKYNVATLRGGVEFGEKTARGQLLAKADLNQKRYSRSFVADSRDNDILNVLLGLRARVMPKTKFLIDYEIADTKYEKSLAAGGAADTKDNRILAGLTWENTAQTTGQLRLGQGNRQVDGKPDIDKFTWDLGLIWKPVMLDTFTISGGARTSDATAPYTSIESTNYSVSWTHDWLERVNSTVNLGVSSEDYSGGPARTDDTTNYGINVNYQMRRWLILNAGINVSDKDSNLPNFSNKRNIMSIGAQVSL